MSHSGDIAGFRAKASSGGESESDENLSVFIESIAELYTSFERLRPNAIITFLYIRKKIHTSCDPFQQSQKVRLL